MIRATVQINGTDVNRWRKLGLTCNPFPQIARAEYSGLDAVLQQLDADPIPDETALRERIASVIGDHTGDRGYDEFVAICIANFRPGERAGFELVIEEP